MLTLTEDERAWLEKWLSEARQLDRSRYVYDLVDKALGEITRLREAQTRHLALIAHLTKVEPTDGEVYELRSQNAALIAEVGTLRSRLREVGSE